MPFISPPYPSFSLVITEAYFQESEERAPELFSVRYHPYDHPTTQFPDEHLMARVDYRYTLQPSPFTSLNTNPLQAPGLPTNNRDSDSDSDESHFFAVYNLEQAVRGSKETRLRKRASLSNIVIDLALLFKEKCKRLVPSGSPHLRAMND